MLYYYVKNDMVMTMSGSFTKNRNRWMLLTEIDKKKIESGKRDYWKPTKKGIFIQGDKFMPFKIYINYERSEFIIINTDSFANALSMASQKGYDVYNINQLDG
jgi:hypothetical protein